MKLYDLTSNYSRLLDMATEEDADLQMIHDTLESIEGDITDKIDGIVRITKTIEAEEEAIKKEEERLYARRKTLENKRESMKDYILNNMVILNTPKIKTALFTLNLRNSQAVKITNEAELPHEFLIPQPPKVDKKGITEALKNGVVVAGAEFETKQSLAIK